MSLNTALHIHSYSKVEIRQYDTFAHISFGTNTHSHVDIYFHDLTNFRDFIQSCVEQAQTLKPEDDAK